MATHPYTLDARQREFEPGETVPFRFRVLGSDGKTVTSYRMLHERELHLIVVRRDLATFSHVHPTRDEHGMWEVELPLPNPGPYRAFADLAPTDGPDVTVSVDLVVGGEWEEEPLPAPSRTVETDGYLVEVAGTLAAGAHSELSFTVGQEGRPVPLEPYLGALGHLVALRASDLAYLHVHPLEDSTPEAVRFGIEVPSAGPYRLFLQFVHRGHVQTAAFTLEASLGEGHAEASIHHGRHGAGH